MSKKFPNDFYHFGAGKHTKHLSDPEIDTYVQKVKKQLKHQEKHHPKDYTSVMSGTGDTLVIGYRTEECKVIHVCRNYYEMSYAYKE